MEKISYTEFIDNIVEKSKDSNQILYATIELTNACNFKCKHCYLGSKNKIKYIDKNDLFKILQEENHYYILILKKYMYMLKN